MRQACQILTLAAQVLVRAPRYWSQGPRAPWRPKARNRPERFDAVQIERMAEAGFLEIGPRGRWARLTEAGRALVEAAQ